MLTSRNLCTMTKENDGENEFKNANELFIRIRNSITIVRILNQFKCCINEIAFFLPQIFT